METTTTTANTSRKIQVRLNAAEVEMLRVICNPANGINRNPSEMIRTLIHREAIKATADRSVAGWSQVKDAAVSSEWRRGRPKAA